MKQQTKIFTVMLLAFFVMPMNVFAAEKQTYTGKIVDDNGEALPGANITNKTKPSEGCITDNEGKFSCSLTSANAVVSYLGYKTQEISLTPQNNNIVLSESSENIDEVVVLGSSICSEPQAKDQLTAIVEKLNVEIGSSITYSEKYKNCQEFKTAVESWVASCGEKVDEAGGQAKYQDTNKKGMLSMTCLIDSCFNGEAPTKNNTVCPEKNYSEIDKKYEDRFNTITTAFNAKIQELKQKLCTSKGA